MYFKDRQAPLTEAFRIPEGCTKSKKRFRSSTSKCRYSSNGIRKATSKSHSETRTPSAKRKLFPVHFRKPGPRTRPNFLSHPDRSMPVNSPPFSHKLNGTPSRPSKPTFQSTPLQPERATTAIQIGATSSSHFSWKEINFPINSENAANENFNDSNQHSLMEPLQTINNSINLPSNKDNHSLELNISAFETNEFRGLLVLPCVVYYF